MWQRRTTCFARHDPTCLTDGHSIWKSAFCGIVTWSKYRSVLPAGLPRPLHTMRSMNGYSPLHATRPPSSLAVFSCLPWAAKQTTTTSMVTMLGGQTVAARNLRTVQILRLQRQKGKHRFRRFTLCVVLKTQTTTSGRYIYRLGYYDGLKRRLIVNLRMVAFVLAKGVQVTKKVYELLLRPHILIKSSEMSYEEQKPFEHPYMKMALEAQKAATGKPTTNTPQPPTTNIKAN